MAGFVVFVLDIGLARALLWLRLWPKPGVFGSLERSHSCLWLGSYHGTGLSVRGTLALT